MNSREVMQQALEAIRIFRAWETGQDYESCRATVLARALAAEESLGAALAEPPAYTNREVMQMALEALEQSETFVPYEGFGMARREAERKHQAAITALRAALAEPTCKDDLQVEPVAWMDVDDRGNMLSLRFWSEGGHEEVPLYTHPAPQHQPLTDEEVDYIWESEKAFPDIYAIVRAIERAHGIGGKE